MGITHAQMQEFIDLHPPAQEQQRQQLRSTYTGANKRLDVRDYLSKYGIECIGEKQHGSSKLYTLEYCVFDSSHKRESAIGQTDDGVLFYQCFHNSCKGRTWKEARQLISGDEPLFRGNLDSNREHWIAPDSTRIALDSKGKQENSTWKAHGEQVEPIAPMVRRFIENGSGKFKINDVTTHVSATSRRDKQCVYLELNKLLKIGKISKIDHEMNTWEVVEPEPNDMNIEGDSGEPANIPLPLNISGMINIYPGSIILIAGSSNAGKTAFLLSILNSVLSRGYPSTLFKKREKRVGLESQSTNVHPKSIRYLNCEMSAGELRSRLSSFGSRLISEWTEQVSFIERSRLFHQMVLPDGLTFIDYLDITEDFFEAPHLISQIHEQLDTGIAIVAMQKPPDRKFAIGGAQTIAKPRLVINLDSNDPYGMIAKLIKVKEPVDFRSKPQGKEIDFLITPSCDFQPLSGWRFVNQLQRKTINAQHQRELDSVDQTPAQVEVIL